MAAFFALGFGTGFCCCAFAVMWMAARDMAEALEQAENDGER